MKKFVTILLIILIGLGWNVSSALAHVVVKPNEVGVGERLDFAVSVPTEGEFPTVGVRLLVPDSVQSVRPNVKPGWVVELVKTGEGENAKVTEIIWSGGTIPPEQRDEFVFSAQAPVKESELTWKAYQTYADGSVVAWDASPDVIKAYEAKNPQAGEEAADAPKPYSVTKVVNDLKESETMSNSPDISGKNRESFQTLGAVVAIALSAAALAIVLRKKK